MAEFTEKSPGEGIVCDVHVVKFKVVYHRQFLESELKTASNKKTSAVYHTLLIEIAKQNNTTLYIGLFDLAKAFDKVSRFRLLQKLVTK